MNKAEKIRRALLKYPKASVELIMVKCGCSKQDIYNIRYKMKKQNKANGYAPLEMIEGVEVGRLTLTKNKEGTYRWVRNDVLEEGKEQGWLTEVEEEAEVGGFPPASSKQEGEPVGVGLHFDTTSEVKEEVNHPPHYTVGGIEVIDFIEAKQLNFNLGNVVKYLSRAGEKDSDPLQDLQKARWYLNREIARVE